MSKISVYKKINDEYKEELHQNIYLLTDYLGNIYLKHNDHYYTVSLDAYHKAGIELNKIYNTEYFRKNLIESKFLADAVKSGVINMNNSLAGKAQELLNNMNEDELEEYIEKNNFSSFDTSFHEKKYFWVKYNDDDDINDDVNDDNFYLNGITDTNNDKGMLYSDLLSVYPGTFDTILIDGDILSKRVISNTERIDGYCTSRLTVYTSGYFRSNFIDSSKYGKLCINDDNNLTIEQVNTF